MSEPVRRRSDARLGSAMFTAVMSRMTISWATSRTDSSRPLFFVAVEDLLRCSISCFSLSQTLLSEVLKQTVVSDVKPASGVGRDEREVGHHPHRVVLEDVAVVH